MQLEERTAGFYDSDATDYDELRFRTEAGRRNHDSQIELIESLLPAETGRTLEVGSGTGRFTRVLAPKASDYFIADVARQMLVSANAATPSTQPVMGDATRLPVKSASIDTLVCLNVLNHIPAFDQALKEFARVLKPDGRLLVNFNNLRSPYFIPGLIVNSRKRAFRADVFSHWQTWSAFCDALSGAGLTIAASRGHLHIPTKAPQPLVKAGSRLDSFLRNRASLAPAPILLAKHRS
jgi:SAM-dependent methyltransferase